MAMIGSLAALAMLGMQPVATEVSVPGPQGPLAGILLAPQGEARAALLILPGSGPTDRNGNNPMGVAAAPYRLLAEALAERGIATVRIDKRGVGGSRGALADANAVTIRDYAADAAAWLSEVRARTGARCVWLLGHSEGGLIALAAREGPNVCGLILVASPGRPLGQALREQLRANPANAPFLDQALAGIEQLEAGQRVDSTAMHPALQPLFAPQVQGYLMDLLSQDPAAMLAGYDRPVLVLNGARDIQIGEADARALANANSRVQLVMLANVNHVLKHVDSDDRSANAATYSNPNLPLAAGVVETIVAFVTQHRAP